MINAISAADFAFIMSSSTSAWLLSPLECSPQKQNGRTLRFCFWGWIIWKMYNKTIIEFGFRMISWIIKTSCLCYLTQPSASADNTDLGFDNSWYHAHAQPYPIIVFVFLLDWKSAYGAGGGGGGRGGVLYANAYDIKKKPPEIRVVSDKHLIPRLFTSYL